LVGLVGLFPYDARKIALTVVKYPDSCQRKKKVYGGRQTHQTHQTHGAGAT
jgi:hypothetical protein